MANVVTPFAVCMLCVVCDIKQVQQKLGDCFLLGAMSVMAMRENLIKNIFLAYDVNAGVYALRIFRQGIPTVVIVDDRLPCCDDGSLAFGRGKDIGELWIPIIEKAYAKSYGTYANIVGGTIDGALADLSGGLPEVQRGKEISAGGDKNWKTLLEMDDGGM